MRNFILLLLILLLSLFATDAPAESAERWVIDNVHVVPMSRNEVLHDRSVLIENGRITGIRAAGTRPEGYRPIDGRGGFLMPGLAEMHAHVPGERADRQLREDILFLYLSNGVTLARGMLGEPWHLELREALTSEDMLGPRLITSGPSFNGNSVESPEQGADMVREQAEAGYDFLKIHPGLSREEFDAVVEAAREVGIRFAGHVPEDVGIDRALEARYASIDHLDRYPRALVDEETLASVDPGFFDYRLAPFADEDAIPEIAERTRDAGVWNVPTETLMHNLLLMNPDMAEKDRPELRYLPADMVERWQDWARRTQADEDYDRQAAEAFMALRKDLIKALHEAGAGLLMGSDAPQVFNVPGFSIHHEMAIMEAAGLSPYEVLRTATVNPARFFNAEDDWGQVREGMRAELILLDGNPLEDLSNLRDPRGVMIGSRWLDREAIGRKLRAIEDRYARD